MNTDRIYRMGAELRAADTQDGMRIHGRAIIYNTPTVLFTDEHGTEYREIIDAHALDTANTRDVCLRYNHKMSVPVLARMRGGSLVLDNQPDGLYFNATLFNTQAARDCFELVRQGALQCSFGFTMPPDGGFVYDADTHTRTITRIDRLIDLSIVDVPAYDDTFVQARSAESLENVFAALENESRQNRRIAEERRRRCLLALTF